MQTAHGTLAIGSTRTVALFAPGSAHPADNHTAIIEFLVDDVDALYEDLQGVVEDFVNVPTTMPWSNRALCCATPTATWSTSSPRRPPRRSRSSATDRPGADPAPPMGNEPVHERGFRVADLRGAVRSLCGAMAAPVLFTLGGRLGRHARAGCS